MDGGRAPRPAQRVVNRTGATHQQAAAQAPSPKPQPQAVQRSTVSAQYNVNAALQPKSFLKRFMIPLVAGVLVALLIGGFVWIRIKNPSTATAIDSSKYQAVFFTNGQVYFGKLSTFNKENMKLRDIYYLQTQSTGGNDSENPQQTANDKKNVQLIKLGDEVHGPIDEMIISKDQLLFFENLKPEGKVAQSIDQYKSSNP